MNQHKVLVVEDDTSTRTYLVRFLASRGYDVDSAKSGEELLARLSGGCIPDVITLDMLLPGMEGKELLERLQKRGMSIPVIVISGAGQIRNVVEAMKMGASDYLVKPFEEEELILSIESALEKQGLRNEIKTLRHQLDSSTAQTDIVTTNPEMLRIKEIAKQVADTDVPILILGESGVGKEVLARFVHSQSSRRDKPFVKVTCAAIPHDLLESELFGYEQGAFTGALTEKPGKFELAAKGTILLDEIGEMSTLLQAKLLHVLQDGEFARLGSKRSLRATCRVLATTNRKLSEAVAQGQFREDLYYRLKVIPITIPPLRERKEDIPLLCNYLSEKYRLLYNSPVHQLPAELLDLLLRYHWPGNIRQLENVIKRYLILPDIAPILAELEDFRPSESGEEAKHYQLKDVSAHAAEQAEREMVFRILDQTNWNRKQAAQRLGICYKALLNKLKKWQVKQPPRGRPYIDAL
jgi:two-component system, NtrC family, response regulator AtoC